MFILPKGLLVNQFHLKKSNEKQATSVQYPEKQTALHLDKARPMDFSELPRRINSEGNLIGKHRHLSWSAEILIKADHAVLELTGGSWCGFWSFGKQVLYTHKHRSPFQLHFVPQVGEVETTLDTMYIGNYLISEIMGHSHICQKTLADLLMSFSKLLSLEI